MQSCLDLRLPKASRRTRAATVARGADDETKAIATVTVTRTAVAAKEMKSIEDEERKNEAGVATMQDDHGGDSEDDHLLTPLLRIAPRPIRHVRPTHRGLPLSATATMTTTIATMAAGAEAGAAVVLRAHDEGALASRHKDPKDKAATAPLTTGEEAGMVVA